MQDRKEDYWTIFESNENLLKEFLRVANCVLESDENKDDEELKINVGLYAKYIQNEDLYLSYKNTSEFLCEMILSFVNISDKSKNGIKLFKTKWNQELFKRNEKGFNIIIDVEEKINYVSSLNKLHLKWYLHNFRDTEIKGKVRHVVNGWFKYCNLNEKLTDLLSTFFSLDSHLFTCIFMILSKELYQELKKGYVIPVFEKYKKVYEKDTGIIPWENEFLAFFDNNWKSYFGDTDSIKETLSAYIDFEVESHYNLPKNRKYKQQTIDTTPQQTLSNEPTDHVEGSKGKLQHREIGLLYYYDKIDISLDIAQNIAESYGWKSPTSGHNIYNYHYVKVRDDVAERYQHDTSTKYLQRIIPLLKTSKGIKNANDDLKRAIDYQKYFKKKSPLR